MNCGLNTGEIIFVLTSPNIVLSKNGNFFKPWDVHLMEHGSFEMFINSIYEYRYGTINEHGEVSDIKQFVWCE